MTHRDAHGKRHITSNARRGDLCAILNACSISHCELILSLAVTIFLIVSFGLAANAQLPPPVPTQVCLAPPEYQFVRISPGGNDVAYLHVPANPDEHGSSRSRLLIRSIQSGTEREVPCSLSVQDFFWHADGKHFIVKVPLLENSHKYHAYVLDVTTGAARDLTPFNGIGFESWAYSETVPDELLVTIRMRRPVGDIYRVNVRTGALRLDTENPGDTGDTFGQDWIADQHLQVRGSIAVLPNGGFVVRHRTGKNSSWKNVLELGPGEEPPALAEMSPDDSKLRVFSSTGANTLRLIELDPQTDKQRVIAEDKKFDLWAVTSWRGYIDGYMVYREGGEWYALTKDFEEDLAKLKTVDPGELNVASTNTTNEKWIVCFSSSVNPGSYYFYDRVTKTAKYLFDESPAITRGGLTLSEKRPVHIETRDKLDMIGYLSLPQGIPPEKLPAILLVHGGPEARDTAEYDKQVQWLANRGYAVLQANFRGSYGFGKKFLRLQDREWGGKMIDDLVDAREWLVREGIADPLKIAIMGSSHGGYATLCALAFRPELFRCGIDIAGESSLITAYRTYPAANRFYLPVVEISRGRRTGEEAFLKSRSPLYFADRIKAPLILWHGSYDDRVPLTESHQMVRALRKLYKPVTAYFDSRSGHELPMSDSPFWWKVEETLSVVLGGRVVDTGLLPSAPVEENE